MLSILISAQDVPVPQSEPVYQEIFGFDYGTANLDYKEEVSVADCQVACNEEPLSIGVAVHAPNGTLAHDQKTLCWLKHIYIMYLFVNICHHTV